MWFTDHHHGWWHGWPMMWFWLIVVVAVAWWLWRISQNSGTTGSGTGGAAGRPEDPLEILRRRYAAGEIGDEEFERKRRALSEDGQSPETSEE